MMKIIISPAKKLNFDKEDYLATPTSIEFGAEAEKLIGKLKKLKPKAISDLMKLSPALADLNYERYHKWALPFNQEEIKAAAFAFDGEVYSGLNIRDFSKEDLVHCQNQLMILSGLYGILKPMDEILPYRLEMGTSLKYSKTINNLYQFWGDKLTKRLQSNLNTKDVLVNLASEEYAKSIDFKKIKNTCVTPVFKEQSGDQFKIVMVYAKQARGLMTQFIIKNQIKTISELKSFDIAGYSYNENLSEEDKIVFTR
jgi:uncharacterized protein